MRNLKIAVVLSSILTSAAAFAQNAMVQGEVNDPSMLKNLKVGDKVKFEAERASEGVTITKMQKSK